MIYLGFQVEILFSKIYIWVKFYFVYFSMPLILSSLVKVTTIATFTATILASVIYTMLIATIR